MTEADLRRGSLALSMLQTDAWKELAAWLEREIEAETNRLTKGVDDWTTYREGVARINAWKRTLAKPEEWADAYKDHMRNERPP